jgi:DNA invertase Pin-like site-specific DNA recombinase
LADQWANTDTPHGKLMVTVLGGLAEFERMLIRARTEDGRKRALAAGIRFGRKPKLTPYHRQEAPEWLTAGESQLSIARTMGVDRSTISRLRLPISEADRGQAHRSASVF